MQQRDEQNLKPTNYMLKTLLIGGLILFVCALKSTPGATVSSPEKTQQNQQTAGKRTSSLQVGDVFQGRVELAQPRHNPAELTIYIKKASSKNSENNAFDIEAIAVMQIRTERSIYSLEGIYVPSCKQINLYKIHNTQPPQSSVSSNIIMNEATFEPVGLAGQITDDDQTIHCQIAFNGNGSLRRSNTRFGFDQTILSMFIETKK